MGFIGRLVKRRTNELEIATAIGSCQRAVRQILDLDYDGKMRQEPRFRSAVLRLKSLTGLDPAPLLDEFYHAHTPRSQRRSGPAYAIQFNVL